jgi:spore maturation protein SpmB
MQRFTIKDFPEFKTEFVEGGDEQKISFKSEGNMFLRVLNSILDGGKTGVDLGLAIIPGVLIISTFVMILTFGASPEGYTGKAYEGIALLPYLAGKINFVFEWLFGFTNPELIAFPITALGAVGAALGLVPKFQAAGLLDGNAVAVFTAMGMCWSGYLSTHTAMLDSLGYRKLTGKAILSHTIGGLFAGIGAHWLFVLISLF